VITIKIAVPLSNWRLIQN